MKRTALALVLAAGTLGLASCNSEPMSPSTSLTTGMEVAFVKGGALGVVYVTSQGLYYDTFVAKDPLPMKGKFQLIANGETEFGPGDPGYLGGRWWEDANGNGVQDTGDHFFLCPLLPPGRPTP